MKKEQWTIEEEGKEDLIIIIEVDEE